DVVGGQRSLAVARDLHGLPGGKALEDVADEDAEAALERLDLAVQVHPRALRERLQLLDLLLEIDDRLLEFERVAGRARTVARLGWFLRFVGLRHRSERPVMPPIHDRKSGRLKSKGRAQAVSIHRSSTTYGSTFHELRRSRLGLPALRRAATSAP